MLLGEGAPGADTVTRPLGLMPAPKIESETIQSILENAISEGVGRETGDRALSAQLLVPIVPLAWT